MSIIFGTSLHSVANFIIFSLNNLVYYKIWNHKMLEIIYLKNNEHVFRRKI